MIPVIVETTINTRISTLGYDVAWANVNFTPADDLYLRVSYLESRPESEAFGGDRTRAIVQVDVVDRKGRGAIKAATVANALEALFTFNTRITASPHTIRVDGEPYSSTRLNDNDNGWFFIPVSIPFEVY